MRLLHANRTMRQLSAGAIGLEGSSVRDFAYSPAYESLLHRICETVPRGYYRTGNQCIPWTEEELITIRLVLRKLTALRVGNPHDAEDLVQETLLTMVRKAPKIDIEKGLLIWCLGILRRKIGNYYRRVQRLNGLMEARTISWDKCRGPEGTPSPESSLHLSELLAAVEEVLFRLPPLERQVIDSYLMGMETREIAAMLSPERYQNVVNRLHRGRKKLAKELARQGYNGARTGKHRLLRFRSVSGRKPGAS